MTLGVLGTVYNVVKVVDRRSTTSDELVEFLFPNCSDEQKENFKKWFSLKARFSDNIICSAESRPFQGICERLGLDPGNRKLVLTKLKLYVLTSA